MAPKMSRTNAAKLDKAVAKINKLNEAFSAASRRNDEKINKLGVVVKASTKKINAELAKRAKRQSKKIIKKVPPHQILKILRNLFIFDLIMAVLYMTVLYESDNWHFNDDTNDRSFFDKLVNRIYYSLMISSTIGPPGSFVPKSRMGKLLTVFHIYLSIMFLPFLLVAIIGIHYPISWFDF